MKKVIFIFAVAALTAGASGADEIYAAVSDCTDEEPANISSGLQLNAFWTSADTLGGGAIYSIQSDDGNYYDRPNLNHETWVWIMVQVACSDYTGHIIDWEGVTDAYASYGMEVYAWNNETENFDYMDEGPKTWWTAHREFGLRKSYFVYDSTIQKYIALILIQGHTVFGKWAMYIDMANIEDQ